MNAFYHVATRSSGLLAATDGSAIRSDTRADKPILLLRPPGMSTVGFMAAPDATVMSVEGLAIKAALQPWRIRAVPGGAVLVDPLYGHCLVERDGGRMVLVPPGETAGADLLRLQPLAEAGITDAMRAMLAAILRMLPTDLNGPDMLDKIAGLMDGDVHGVAQAVLRLLPRDQVEWLGATLLGLPGHLDRFARANPRDIWAAHGLPALRDWLATRRSPATQAIGPEDDHLAEAGLSGQPTSIGHLLSMAARASIPPRHPACVVATARNEGLYLLEWIAYHRLVGADAIFIYSNDNSDGSDDLLRTLALAGEITWIENRLERGRGAQPKAYGHAFGLLPGVLDFRWSLVIDLDEFFGFDTNHFRSLSDYVAWQETQAVSAISLNWLVFGSNGTAAWNDAPMVERFTKRLPWLDPHIKSISRTNLCVQSHPHHAAFGPFRPIVTRDSDAAPYECGAGFSHSKTPKADRAWISHYFLKSAEEFVWKFSRNRGDHALVKRLDPAQIEPGFATMFLQQHQSPTMVDDPRTVACAPGLRQEIARLRALPGVAAAEGRIVTDYGRIVRDLVQELRSQPALKGAESPYPGLAALCR